MSDWGARRGTNETVAFLSSLRGWLYFNKEIQILWLFFLIYCFTSGWNGSKASTVLCGLWSALCATAARNMSTSIWRVGLLVQQKLASLIFSAVKVRWVQQTAGISISPSLISNLRGESGCTPNIYCIAILTHVLWVKLGRKWEARALLWDAQGQLEWWI